MKETDNPNSFNKSVHNRKLWLFIVSIQKTDCSTWFICLIYFLLIIQSPVRKSWRSLSRETTPDGSRRSSLSPYQHDRSLSPAFRSSGPHLNSPNRNRFSSSSPTVRKLDLISPRSAGKGRELDLTSPRSAGKGGELDLTSPRSAGKGRELDLTSPRSAGKGRENASNFYKKGRPFFVFPLLHFELWKCLIEA